MRSGLINVTKIKDLKNKLTYIYIKVIQVKKVSKYQWFRNSKSYNGVVKREAVEKI